MRVIAQFRSWFYEKWYRASSDENMRRCSCWRHLIGSDGVAVDNGWVPTWKSYPHADYCKNPDR